ncbi:R-spondin-2 [Egretta garzetta]|nr:R-spondin-2 [Egretta garzetta]
MIPSDDLLRHQLLSSGDCTSKDFFIFFGAFSSIMPKRNLGLANLALAKFQIATFLAYAMYCLCSGNVAIPKPTASYGPNPICKGCLSCSKDNGCIRCQHKLFLSGYYGLRTPDMNRCSRCRIENCDSCFSRDFCTKCKTGFYSHRGRCFRGCPPGFAALEELMECVEGCEVGQWSEWGTCSRNNKTCGFKWGLETRTRQIVKKPAKDTILCPTIAESRRCKMAMRHCPGGRRPTKTKDKKKKKKNLMERAQKQHSIFLATDKTSQ